MYIVMSKPTKTTVGNKTVSTVALGDGYPAGSYETMTFAPMGVGTEEIACVRTYSVEAAGEAHKAAVLAISTGPQWGA